MDIKLKYYNSFEYYILLEATQPINKEDEIETSNKTDKQQNDNIESDDVKSEENQKTDLENKKSQLPNPNKNGNIQALNNKLEKWNLVYSQVFKFINDKPSVGDVTEKTFDNQYKKLISSISNEFKPSVSDSIKKITDILLDPEYNIDKKIEVAGHTSSTGSDKYNQSLSERRSNLVRNAILDYVKNSLKKDNTTIKTLQDKLIIQGYGEKDPIIINDNPKKDNNGEYPPIQISKGVKGGSDMDNDAKKILQEDPKARQLINRRVEINLEGTKNKSLPKKEVVIQNTGLLIDPKKKKNITINPNSFQFYDNSYILLDESKKALDKLIENVNNTDKEIKDIYISAHAESRKKDPEYRQRSIFTLSLNRSYVVKSYFRKRVTKKDITYHTYGCADKLSIADSDYKGKISDEKRVEIMFETPMPMAEKIQASISKKLSIEISDKIIPNEDLKDLTLRWVKKYLNDDKTVNKLRKVCVDGNFEQKPIWMGRIPREFWFEGTHTMTPEFGEESPKKYQRQIKRIINKRNRLDSKMKKDDKIIPQVFFTKDLTNKTKDIPKNAIYTALGRDKK